MTDEIVYSASEVYKRLGISDSTLRKYMEVLQREKFVVKKDNRGRRQYTDNDIMVIEKLIELSKHDGMTLEKAAKMIAQQIEKVNPDLIQEEAEETDLVPFHIKQQLQEQYSVMAKEMNQGMLAMEKRLSDQAKQSNVEIKASIEEHNERVEKRLEARDETLMKTLREMQEAKRLMQEFRDEVAAAKEKKKPWWKFW
jgi:DNA-binding transcriptional MerR regulator